MNTELKIRIAVFAVLFSMFAAIGHCQELPDAPTKAADGATFHRADDFAFGAVISGIAGASTNRPWVGLVAGEAAGIANEARYGKNFNMGHLAVITAGSLASYGILKLMKRHDAKKVGR